MLGLPVVLLPEELTLLHELDAIELVETADLIQAPSKSEVEVFAESRRNFLQAQVDEIRNDRVRQSEVFERASTTKRRRMTEPVAVFDTNTSIEGTPDRAATSNRSPALLKKKPPVDVAAVAAAADAAIVAREEAKQEAMRGAARISVSTVAPRDVLSDACSRIRSKCPDWAPMTMGCNSDQFRYRIYRDLYDRGFVLPMI